MLRENIAKHWLFLLRPSGFEPLTYRLEGGRSIQLSYGRGLELVCRLDDTFFNRRLTKNGSELEAECNFVSLWELSLLFMVTLLSTDGPFHWYMDSRNCLSG